MCIADLHGRDNYFSIGISCGKMISKAFWMDGFAAVGFVDDCLAANLLHRGNL
jgi:hypothetical protein